jgi:glycosyltransferase involved in cell wall biosynthesis
MGVHAAKLAGILDADPVRVPLDRTLIVADFEPDECDLQRLFGGAPGVQLLPAAPERPLRGVVYRRYRTGTNPIAWEDGTDDVLRGLDTVVFLLPPREIRGQTLLRFRQLGVRRVLIAEQGRFRETSPLAVAARRKLESLGRRLITWLGVSGDSLAEDACRHVLTLSPPARPSPDADRPLRIVYFANSLNSGGAERQLCYSAIGQRRRGHDVRVFVRQALVGADAHYLPLLREHDITVIRIGLRKRCQSRSLLLERLRTPLSALPGELRDVVADLAGELLADPADVVHAFVDDANVPAAIAAALTGTPGVVLSFRNGNPTHFPGLHRPWMRPVYRAVRDRIGVRFSANSVMGARDYERWLALPEQSTPVVRNAFVPPPPPSSSIVDKVRQELKLEPQTPVVVGVYRLEAEKRPLLFLECARRLRDIVPGVRVLLAGVGSLEDAVRSTISDLNLEATLSLLGQRADVPELLSLGDVLLLTSDWEGTPNVVLEAQHAGCVPVATDAGGTREALVDGVTGVLVDVNDRDGLVRAVADLLQNSDRRRRMAAAGEEFVSRQFSSAVLDAENEQLYRSTLAANAVPLVTFSTSE